MLKPIQAKTLLTTIKQPDPWFGLKYNMNLYRGCQHRCIYCDSRSECYQIENFDSEILYKENAIELLDKELKSKRIKGPIGFGSMNDPYMPIEKDLELTKRALEIAEKYAFPVTIITKSALILRDIELLKRINKVSGQVIIFFTITTTNDALAAKIEPGSSRPSERLKALKILSENGIYTAITIMPILPFIEDTKENIEGIVVAAAQAGVKCIIPGFGVTLRNRQRDYFYEKLDQLFPGVREKYEKAFGNRYSCSVKGKELSKIFYELCKKHGIETKVRQYKEKKLQMQLFNGKEASNA